MDEQEAYQKFIGKARERHPGHKVQLRVIIPLDENYEPYDNAQIVN
jgi:hypothetical protein